jgi:hypothetical protein
VSLRKKAQAPATVAAWSVSDLSALYTQNRSSLIAQARRILPVSMMPNEITTRIILNSSKISILAQAINIGAKGVK